MGITNFMVNRMMKKEAKSLAVWAAQTYPAIKAQIPAEKEKEILCKMLRSAVVIKSEENARKIAEQCCLSIEALCYFIAMELGKLKGFSVLRSLQFTRYMDAELYARGFTPQSIETKGAIFKLLGLPDDRI
jgi:hypothetical protein